MIYISKFLSKKQLSFYFHGWSLCNMEKPRVISLTSSSASFCNIRDYRECCSTNLISKSIFFIGWKTFQKYMKKLIKLESSLPYFKITIVRSHFQKYYCLYLLFLWLALKTTFQEYWAPSDPWLISYDQQRFLVLFSYPYWWLQW